MVSLGFSYGSPRVQPVLILLPMVFPLNGDHRNLIRCGWKFPSQNLPSLGEWAGAVANGLPNMSESQYMSICKYVCIYIYIYV